MKFIAFPILFLFAVFNTYAQEIPALPVEVEQVQTKLWQPEVKATGTLVANPGVLLRTEIGGRVQEITFTPGEVVEKDSPLVQLNPDILQAELEAANAALALSELNFARMKELFDRKTVSKADLDKSEATLKNDKAAVSRAQAFLNQTLIRAPFSGRVGLNKVNVGDYVSPGTELVQIQAIDPIRVDFRVPEAYAGHIKEEQEVQVTTALYPGEIFVGNLGQIDASIDQATRTLALRAYIPNKDYKLLPGAFADIVLFLGDKKEWPIIRQTAVVFDVNGNYVYKVVDGKVVKTLVELGSRLNGEVLIEKGLVANDQVVISGQLKLHDGMPVHVLEKKG